MGTRASALALAQARWVAELLPEESELVPISTSGDRRGPVSDKSRWIAELERALLEERIDIAVHSAKDVPAELAEGLSLVAIPRRADARDAICGAGGLSELAQGATVGTSSLRRAAQLRAAREDLRVVEMRGNVDTRLRKLSEGAADALVLACAGLERLGRFDEAGGVLEELVPAAGQGALAIEGRGGHVPAAVVEALDDPETAASVHAERELTRRLDASCNTPVGAHARPCGGATIELRAWVGLPDGSRWISDSMRGASEGLGVAVAERMLAVGARELLERAELEVGA
ncbi:MAG: hydroxymethylbilane synthase [Solirubrobacterales bacterium]|nr:hydroxymethylbilane synthase [Solirubrobacterales bacterium]MBV9164802.1 hydroxymethylbilane synthase [Solirubrobacterales bacterium]